MPKIDHDMRKRQIVAESVKLFATCGYAQVNFGMIAKASGVARTLLYTYFTNKRAIFNAAIDEVTDMVRAEYRKVEASAACADRKLRQICTTVFNLLFGNRSFVCVISDVLSGYRRRGGSVPVDRVISHTSGLLKIMRALIAEGVANGEYRQGIDPRVAANLLYSQYEAVALRIAVTGNADMPSCLEEMDMLISSLRPA